MLDSSRPFAIIQAPWSTTLPFDPMKFVMKMLKRDDVGFSLLADHLSRVYQRLGVKLSVHRCMMLRRELSVRWACYQRTQL